ncbi:MAG TPA: anti-sigma factor [Candidatus Limnocylindrales bacterium]
MDHDETKEQLELAVLEPGGLERLMAGDTPAAQAVAGHLAGCPACTEELVRLRRSAAVIGAGLRELPPPELRSRTLAAIRSEGVVRPLVPAVAVLPLAGDAAADGGSTTTPVPAPATVSRRRWTRAVPMIATVAAAVVLSVATTTLVIGSRVDDQLAQQARTIDSLEAVTTMSMAVSAEPDAEHVELAGVGDPSLAGSIVYSPSTTELVVVSSGLSEPAAGYEYRCWVETGGTRERIGKMFFGDDLSYWRGATPVVADAGTTSTFGVSLVAVSATTIDTDPVLVSHP